MRTAPSLLIVWWMPKTRKVEQADPGTLGCSDGLKQSSVACVCFGDGRAEAIWGEKRERMREHEGGMEDRKGQQMGAGGSRERV